MCYNIVPDYAQEPGRRNGLRPVRETNMTEEISEKILATHVPIPMCVVGENGKIKSVNHAIDRVFQYADLENADFFALTGIRIKDLEKAGEDHPVIERNGRVFALTADREAFAEKLPKTIIMSNKPNPAMLAADSFDEDVVRSDIRRTIKAARRNGVTLEMILKDVSTVRYDISRLKRFCEIATEEAARA